MLSYDFVLSLIVFFGMSVSVKLNLQMWINHQRWSLDCFWMDYSHLDRWIDIHLHPSITHFLSVCHTGCCSAPWWQQSPLSACLCQVGHSRSRYQSADGTNVYEQSCVVFMAPWADAAVTYIHVLLLHTDHIITCCPQTGSFSLRPFMNISGFGWRQSKEESPNRRFR